MRWHTHDSAGQTGHINFHNVCVDSTVFKVDNFAASGANNVVVDAWVNVNSCTIVGGAVVVGAPLSCSANVTDISAGTVTGCPN